jgi:hypothetical protein
MPLARAPFRVRRLLVRALRRPRRGPRRLSVLLAGLVLIAAWQKDFFNRAASLDDRYVHRESTGMNAEWRFVYFLYYTGLVPVVATDAHARLKAEPGYDKFERGAAQRVIAERGETLSMDASQTIRAGDMGRVLLYLPYAVWRGDTRDPRLAPTHAVAFTLALGALYAAFWLVRDPVLGAATTALLGSNPYQLSEVHFRENVFGWAITAGVLTLALSLPLLQRHSIRRPWALLLAIGIVLGTIRQIRPEPGAIVVSAGLACLLVSRASWPRRVALAAVLVAGVLAVFAVFICVTVPTIDTAKLAVSTYPFQEVLWELLITFSLYPEPLFGGMLRLVLFTFLPAGFVGYVPARLLRSPSFGLVRACAPSMTQC